jgi:hypothetical protein
MEKVSHWRMAKLTWVCSYRRTCLTNKMKQVTEPRCTKIKMSGGLHYFWRLWGRTFSSSYRLTNCLACGPFLHLQRQKWSISQLAASPTSSSLPLLCLKTLVNTLGPPR